MKQTNEDRKMKNISKGKKTLAVPLTDFQLRHTQLWVSYCCKVFCCKALCVSVTICNRLLSSPTSETLCTCLHLKTGIITFRKWLYSFSSGDYRAVISIAGIKDDSLLTLSLFSWYPDAPLSFEELLRLIHSSIPSDKWDYFPLCSQFHVCNLTTIFPLLLVHM